MFLIKTVVVELVLGCVGLRLFLDFGFLVFRRKAWFLNKLSRWLSDAGSHWWLIKNFWFWRNWLLGRVILLLTNGFSVLLNILSRNLICLSDSSWDYLRVLLSLNRVLSWKGSLVLNPFSSSTRLRLFLLGLFLGYPWGILEIGFVSLCIRSIIRRNTINFLTFISLLVLKGGWFNFSFLWFGWFRLVLRIEVLLRFWSSILLLFMLIR